MLNKNEIIKELKNKEFIVRNAIYEHICNLHLYFDKNDKFIQKWIKDNKKSYNEKQEMIRFIELYNK